MASESANLEGSAEAARRRRVETMAAPPGDWPSPGSRKLVILAAVAWVAWVAFLVAMMILRFKTTPV